MKSFKLAKGNIFAVTKGNTNRKKGEHPTIAHALQYGIELCRNSKNPYFQVWYKTDNGNFRCEFFNASTFEEV